ncbi:Protein of unknown function [Cotesia congregata]|uniref:BEN domain-containing protein n=1 Tax=Cotesia congregata TaxID=51543 RepID=A0A8J2HIB3_COTCN|nr:Protein of unknown function [Cotesia congregata]
MYKQLKEIKASQANFMRDYARARNNDDENQNDQHELGHVGSGVFISKNSWTTAEQKRSYQSMGKALIKAAFPTEVMLLSNLRGNASKIDKNAPKKPALDLNIMNAIKGYLTYVLLTDILFRASFSTGGLDILSL